MRAFHDMSAAPRDRNILIKAATWGFVAYGKPYRITGYQWVECWWDKDAEKFIEFCGNYRTRTTSHIAPVCWAELPEE